MGLETSIGTAHLSRQVSGDITKANNHWARADFGTKAPGLDWETYFSAAGLESRRASSCGSRPPSLAFPRSRRASRSMLEELSHVSRYSTITPPSSRQFRRPSFAILRAGTERSQEAAGSLEAGDHRHRHRARLRGREALCGEVLPPAEKARAQGMVTNLIAAFRQRDRQSRVDGPSHEAGSQSQAERAEGWSRLSRQLADILRAGSSEGRRLWQRGARAANPVPGRAQETGPAGGPIRVGNDAADRQCSKPSGDECSQLPCRHSPAALLRPRSGHWRWTTEPSEQSSDTK